jgi:TonB family protein
VSAECPLSVSPSPLDAVAGSAAPVRAFVGRASPRAAAVVRWFLVSVLVHAALVGIAFVALAAPGRVLAPVRGEFTALNVLPAEERAATDFTHSEGAPEDLPLPAEAIPPPPEPPVPEIQVLEETLPPELPAVPATAAPPAPSAPLDRRIRTLRPPVSEPAPVASTSPPAASRAAPSRPASVVEGATLLGTNRPPAYPPEARARGLTGVVRLQIEVDTAGRVASVRVTGSSGYAVLDEAARVAALAWRFLPARRDGIPVPARLDQTVRFGLAAGG